MESIDTTSTPHHVDYLPSSKCESQRLIARESQSLPLTMAATSRASTSDPRQGKDVLVIISIEPHQPRRLASPKSDWTCSFSIADRHQGPCPTLCQNQLATLRSSRLWCINASSSSITTTALSCFTPCACIVLKLIISGNTPQCDIQEVPTRNTSIWPPVFLPPTKRGVEQGSGRLISPSLSLYHQRSNRISTSSNHGPSIILACRLRRVSHDFTIHSTAAFSSLA
jgi:hypothetical protein